MEAMIKDANSSTGGGYFQLADRSWAKEVNSESPGTSPKIHDSGDLTTPTKNSEVPGTTGGAKDSAPRSMHGDASEGMSESSKPDHARPGSSSHRRRPRPQPVNPLRTPGTNPSQSHGHAISSNSSENIHNRPPTGFQGSPIHYATVPYTQRTGYVGPYTVSPLPSPMNMPHTPPYPFSHTYHPVVADNNMRSQNIHANYQSMLQQQGPMFSYQHQSLEGGQPSHSGFSGARNSPMYPSHPGNVPTSPSTPHGPSPSGQSSAPAPYIGSTQFHSLQYPTPIPTPPYAYPAQTYSSSSMYQSQFSPSPFAQHYTPTGEAEPQGTWYYLPYPTTSPVPQQYDPGPSYQGHYAVSYPQVGLESGYGGAVASPSSNPSRSSPTYPPSQGHSSRYSDNQTPDDSPHASGAGPPPLSPNTGTPIDHIASSEGGRPPASDRPIVRRSYHPNPPAHRSEWVMWAGNVPSDATHDELWRFFNQPDERATDAGAMPGVLSIFLISRSSCAFVNYETRALLQAAILRFNGAPLRPNDARCPRLVCRVRKKDDDLKAGVGGQRGMGMHTKWVKEQKGKGREVASDVSDVSASDPSDSPTSVSERLALAISNVSISSDEDGKRAHVKHSSSSGSHTSTTSSFLVRNFPKRFFILKSLTQEDLDTSVERNVWATQKHNEEILDQAFRTSKEVILIFSVNKSGEFYGYARMAGPVHRGDHRVPWASRPLQASPASRSLTTPMHPFLSPSDHRFVANSPAAVEGLDSGAVGKQGAKPHLGPSRLRHSAPGLLGEAYHLPTMKTPTVKYSLDQSKRFPVDLRGSSSEDGFELDPSAPVRAIRGHQGPSGPSTGPGSGPEAEKTTAARVSGNLLDSVNEEEEEKFEEDGEDFVADEEGGNHTNEKEKKGEDAWGDSFAVEWISMDRVPFHRTKHLRNPWNHDREIKISRDGTELEPTIGQRLLNEWDTLSDPQPAPLKGDIKPAGGKRPANSKSLPLQLLEGAVGTSGKEMVPRSR